MVKWGTTTIMITITTVTWHNINVITSIIFVHVCLCVCVCVCLCSRCNLPFMSPYIRHIWVQAMKKESRKHTPHIMISHDGGVCARGGGWIDSLISVFFVVWLIRKITKIFVGIFWLLHIRFNRVKKAIKILQQKTR